MTARLLERSRPLALYAIMEILADLGACPQWFIQLVVFLDGPIVNAALRLRAAGVSGA